MHPREPPAHQVWVVVGERHSWKKFQLFKACYVAFKRNFIQVIAFFLVVLEFELRTSHLLGRLSTTAATPSAPFVLVILQIGSCFFAQAGLDYVPPILSFLLSLSSSVEMVFHKLFLPAPAWNWNLPDFSLLSS
jgi:hypothetical protein